MPDAVTHWNDVILDVIRDVGGPPGPIARAGAMMHAAIYDAVNSIVPTHQPYLVTVAANPSASLDAAIAHAAHDVLVNAFPGTAVDLDGELEDALNAAAAEASVTEIAAGKAVGRAASAAMITARTGDGSDDEKPYGPSTKPGQWRPTSNGATAASPNWPSVKPFSMSYGSQFRPPLPGGYGSITEMLKSPEYAAQVDEVKRLGEAGSTERTAEETEIAHFWANDVDQTYKPPGQLFEITQIVSAQRGLDVVENARLFALVGLAMGDAAIVAWDAKYATGLDLWRPETAIQIGNGTVPQIPTWTPLSFDPVKNVHFSPSFPAYVSGHATFAAAHAGIMRRYFGTDNVRFTAATEDVNLPGGVTRTFNSFTQAALENARSRIYLGVHYQWDGDHGFLSGTALAEHIHATRLRPLS